MSEEENIGQHFHFDSARLGPILNRICHGSSGFAIGIKNGRIIRGEKAEVQNVWLLISGKNVAMYSDFDQARQDGFMGFEGIKRLVMRQGLQILISEIAWVANAPEDS